MTSDIALFLSFCYNYPQNFIEVAFQSQGQNIVNHLNSKFLSLYKRHGARYVIQEFYTELDLENRKLLETFIKDYHNNPNLIKEFLGTQP